MPDQFITRNAVERLAEFFENQRDGQFVIDLADALESVTKGVQEHRKGGSVSVSIRLTPIKKTADALSIRDSIKASVPEADQPESMFFADDDGKLGIEHPAQRRLKGVARRPEVGEDPPVDLREAAREAAEVVGAGTGPAETDEPATLRRVGE